MLEIQKFTIFFFPKIKMLHTLFFVLFRNLTFLQTNVFLHLLLVRLARLESIFLYYAISRNGDCITGNSHQPPRFYNHFRRAAFDALATARNKRMHFLLKERSRCISRFKRSCEPMKITRVKENIGLSPPFSLCLVFASRLPAPSPLEE